VFPPLFPFAGGKGKRFNALQSPRYRGLEFIGQLLKSACIFRRLKDFPHYVFGTPDKAFRKTRL